MSLALQGITKRFGATPALHGIDLAAAEGEFLALLGPSGSGKTTLLRMIAGLEAADSGRVQIGGADMAGVPARARGVGFVFQHYALFRHMTVADNIAFGLRVRPRARRPGPAAIRARVAELLALVQMPELAGRYPDQLSGGQRQRVALARALAIEPRVLLLDEPFGALDAEVRRDLRRWLRELHDRTGLTTVMVTHDQAEALEVADRVAIMRGGRVEQVDTPAGLWAAPASAFVYRFIGDAVELPCAVRGGIARFGVPGLPDLPCQLPDGDALAMLRPHEIGLAEGGEARVRAAAAGPSVRVEVQAGGLVIELLLPPGAVPPAIGSACRLDLRAARFFGRGAAQNPAPVAMCPRRAPCAGRIQGSALALS
jgi:sulfate transport system ATP-binding protein